MRRTYRSSAAGVVVILSCILCGPGVAGPDGRDDSLALDSVPPDSVVADTVVASDSQPPDTLINLESELPDRVVLSIERVETATGQVFDTLAVNLQGFGYPVAGFDIKLAVDSRVVDIMDVLPGEVYDSCNWAFFDSRPMPNTDREGHPSQIWQAIALAETVPEDDGPVCFGFDRKASLLRVVVSSGPSVMVDDTSVAIYFFWEDCTDNSLSDRSGNILLYSTQVHDYFPVADYGGKGSFPTRLGAPRSCIDPGVGNPPVRRVELHNGGVEFRFNPDAGGEDATAEDSAR